MAALFDVHVATINEHLKKIYETDELNKSSTIRNFLIVQNEGDWIVKKTIVDNPLNERWEV